MLTRWNYGVWSFNFHIWTFIIRAPWSPILFSEREGYTKYWPKTGWRIGKRLISHQGPVF